jgi:hypothetical protein
MNANIQDKNRKIQMLLDYAKECYKRGHRPTKKDIRQKFHLEIYNYFKNTADYHKKAGIILSLNNCSKDEARRKIIDFIHKKAEEKEYPSRRRIDKKLKIHLPTYFDSLEELYRQAGIDHSLVEQTIKNKILKSNTYNEDILAKQKESIKRLIRQKTKQGFYPSVNYIQKKLSLSFYNLYYDIFEAYKDAGVNYERVSPIILGKKKEQIFTKIVKELFQRMGFTIQRVSIESETDFNRNADMTVLDKDGNRVLVEIKAYRADYCITCREFGQLQRYLKKENINKGIFITTSNSKKCLFDNIRFIDGYSLIELLKKYCLEHNIPTIKWIQESRVNSYEKIEHDNQIKVRIIDYVKSQDKIPTKKEIQKKFKADLRTYFGEVRPYEKLVQSI